MTNRGAVSVRGFHPQYRSLLILLCVAALAPCVSASTVILDTHLDTTGATPFSIWAIVALIGFGLFLVTLKARTIASELEADAIISIIAWIPIAFTAYASFKVDRVVGVFAVASTGGYTLMEDHIIYHFDVIAFLYMILLLFAVVNTVRIISLHKKFLIGEDDRRYQSGEQ